MSPSPFPTSEAPPLNWDRVARLTAFRSPGARAEAAASVAAAFVRDSLTERERAIAVDIIEILARDVERRVREALAEHVKHCPFLPRGVARRLAADIASVALPVIRYSPVLDEDDLLAVVREGVPDKLLALAAREGLTPQLCDALVDTESRPAVVGLLGNRTARMAEAAYHKVIDGFGGDCEVHALMADRPALPLSVTARLIDVVSSALRQRLIARHDMPAALATELAMQGRDRALVAAVAAEPGADAARTVTDELFQRDGVPAMLLLRAVCSGEFRVLELVIALLAGMPADRVRQHLADPGQRAFAWLYRKAGLPDELFRAFRAALDVKASVDPQAGPDQRARYTARVIERLAIEYEVVCDEDLEHVLSQISRRVLRPARRRALRPDLDDGGVFAAANDAS